MHLVTPTHKARESEGERPPLAVAASRVPLLAGLGGSDKADARLLDPSSMPPRSLLDVSLISPRCLYNVETRRERPSHGVSRGHGASTPARSEALQRGAAERRCSEAVWRGCVDAEERRTSPSRRPPWTASSCPVSDRPRSSRPRRRWPPLPHKSLRAHHSAVCADSTVACA